MGNCVAGGAYLPVMCDTLDHDRGLRASTWPGLPW